MDGPRRSRRPGGVRHQHTRKAAYRCVGSFSSSRCPGPSIQIVSNGAGAALLGKPSPMPRPWGTRGWCEDAVERDGLAIVELPSTRRRPARARRGSPAGGPRRPDDQAFHAVPGHRLGLPADAAQRQLEVGVPGGLAVGGVRPRAMACFVQIMLAGRAGVEQPAAGEGFARVLDPQRRGTVGFSTAWAAGPVSGVRSAEEVDVLQRHHGVDLPGPRARWPARRPGGGRGCRPRGGSAGGPPAPRAARRAC